MLRFVLFDTFMFGDGENPEKVRDDLMWLLEVLTQRDQNYLAQHPNTPRLYKSRVRWEAPKQLDGYCEEYLVLKKALGRLAEKRDVARVLDLVQQVFGGERFCDVGRILERGSIDCDGLAAWRTAELRQADFLRGIRPYMTHRRTLTGGTIYHALVIWPPFASVPYWTSEDPSLLLGMGGESRAGERAQEIQKNQERCDILRQYGVNGMTAPPADFLLDASNAAMFNTGDLMGARRGQLVQPAGSAAHFAELDNRLRRAA